MSEVSTQVGGPVEVLEQAFRNAIAAALGDEHREVDPGIRPSRNPKFGDYQANFAMGLAKQLETDPRKLAVKVVDIFGNDTMTIVEVTVKKNGKNGGKK